MLTRLSKLDKPVAFRSIRTFRHDNKTHNIFSFPRVAFLMMLHVLIPSLPVTILKFYLTFILLLPLKYAHLSPFPSSTATHLNLPPTIGPSAIFRHSKSCRCRGTQLFSDGQYITCHMLGSSQTFHYFSKP